MFILFLTLFRILFEINRDNRYHNYDIYLYINLVIHRNVIFNLFLTNVSYICISIIFSIEIIVIFDTLFIMYVVLIYVIYFQCK